MQGTFFRGTTHNQDARFSDKEKKLMQTMNFDEILDKKIDLKKVDLDILLPWVEQQVTKILGIDDEVIPAMIVNELESYKKDDKAPNGKLIQIRVTGFLERDAKKFMVDLWKLLIEAQDSSHGIPTSLIDSKKVELKAKEEEFIKNQEQLKKLEEAKEKLKQDQLKLKEINRLFTDRSSSVERKPESSNTNEKKFEGSRKDIAEKKHRESLKKFEEDEQLEKREEKEEDKKKEKKVEEKKNRRSSSSSDSRHKRDNKKKDSYKDRKYRDDSRDRKDRKDKDKYSSRDNKHKSSKSKRDRSRS